MAEVGEAKVTLDVVNNNESSIKGVSVRAWLALIITASGLGFLYLISFVALIFFEANVALQIVLMVIATVSGIIGGATGFYFGQKTTEPVVPPLPPIDPTPNE